MWRTVFATAAVFGYGTVVHVGQLLTGGLDPDPDHPRGGSSPVVLVAADASVRVADRPANGYDLATPRRTVGVVKKLLISVAGLYLGAALGTRAAEAVGLTRCGCSSPCWCRKPSLSAFRWVMPLGHR